MTGQLRNDSALVTTAATTAAVDFFECPWWSSGAGGSTAVSSVVTSWQSRNGCIYHFGAAPPDPLDLIVLTWLFLQSQTAVPSPGQNMQTVTASRYEILRACGLPINSHYYRRLHLCLSRWSAVTISFSGVFHDHKSYRNLTFNLLDRWAIDQGTGLFVITFARPFLTMMSASRACEHIDFPALRQCRSPLVFRLRAILRETLRHHDSWDIDATELAMSLSMSERYPSHIIAKIRAALNRIDQPLLLTHHSSAPGCMRLCFHKHPQPRTQPVDSTAASPVLATPATSHSHSAPNNLNTGKHTTKRAKAEAIHIRVGNDPTLAGLVALLPPAYRQHLATLETIIACYDTYAVSYILRNIEFANQRQTRNYPSRLRKALKFDQGKANALLSRTSPTQQPKMRPPTPTTTPTAQHIREYIAALSPRELYALQRKAVINLPPSLRALIEHNQLGAKTLVALITEGIVARLLSERTKAT